MSMLEEIFSGLKTKYLVLGRWTNPQGVAGNLEILDLCDTMECAQEHVGYMAKPADQAHEQCYAGVTDVRILEVKERVQ